MQTSSVVAVVSLVLAVVLGALAFRGLDEIWLDKGAKIASLLSLVVAVFAAALTALGTPSGGAVSNKTQTIQAGRDIYGDQIQAQGDVHVGAKPEEQFQHALDLVEAELARNLGRVAGTVAGVTNAVPETYGDVRRPNETELAYQERALEDFRAYATHVERLAKLDPPQVSQLGAFTRELSHHATVAEQLRTAADHLAAAHAALVGATGLVAGLEHLAGLRTLSDSERVAKARSLHQEKLCDARIALAQAIAAYGPMSDPSRFRATLVTIEPALPELATVQTPASLSKQALALAATLQRKKAAILADRETASQMQQASELERLVTDPYLRFLREQVGLPQHLTEAEHRALGHRELMKSTDPGQLLQWAAMAFLEYDSRSCEHYLEQAVRFELSEKQTLLVEGSLARLANPDLYGVLGVLVTEVDSDGGFASAGVQVGDVVVRAGERLVQEPGDISAALGQSPQGITLVVVRDGRRVPIPMAGRRSAGAEVSPLIIANLMRI